MTDLNLFLQLTLNAFFAGIGAGLGNVIAQEYYKKHIKKGFKKFNLIKKKIYKITEIGK